MSHAEYESTTPFYKQKFFISLLALAFLMTTLLLVAGRPEQNQEATLSTVGVTTNKSTMDSGNQNGISATQVTAGENGGLLSSISVYVGSVQAAPKNHIQLAVYADDGANTPGTLLAKTSAQVLRANQWNTFPVSNITIAARARYWLAFNVDGRNTEYAISGSNTPKSVWKIPTRYGTWPSTFGSLSEPIGKKKYSIYMTYAPVATPLPTSAPPATPSPMKFSPTFAPTPAAPTPAPTAAPLLGQLSPQVAPTPVLATATPVPQSSSGQLYGWQLNAANTGLAPLSLNCSSLPLYTGPSKLPAGTTITEKRIETDLDLSAGNITVERSCIRPRAGAISAGDSLVTTADVNRCDANGCTSTNDPVAIRDSEIDGSLITNPATIAYSCAFAGIATLQRNYMHDVGSGICFTKSGDHLSAVVEGNFVDRLRAWGVAGDTGSHNESFTVREFDTRTHPDRRLVVRNNRFEAFSGNDTGALFIQAWAGYIDQVSIEGNLLESSNYKIILEANANGYGRNINAINNRFGATGGSPGYVQAGSLDYGWATWQENYINDPTKPGNKGTSAPSPRP